MGERKSLSAQLKILDKAYNVLTRNPTFAAIGLDDELEVSNEPTAASTASRLDKTNSAVTRDPPVAHSYAAKSAATAARPANAYPSPAGQVAASPPIAGASGGLFGSDSGSLSNALDRVGQSVVQAKQKVAQQVVNQAASQASGGRVNEVPPVVAQTAVNYAENNPEQAMSAAKQAASLLGKLG